VGAGEGASEEPSREREGAGAEPTERRQKKASKGQAEEAEEAAAEERLERLEHPGRGSRSGRYRASEEAGAVLRVKRTREAAQPGSLPVGGRQ